MGRFTGVDALAEMYQPLTPYHYAANNPVNYNDPSGLITNPGFGATVWAMIEGAWNAASASGGYSFTKFQGGIAQEVVSMNGESGFIRFVTGNGGGGRGCPDCPKTDKNGRNFLSENGFFYMSYQGGWYYAKHLNDIQAITVTATREIVRGHLRHY